MIAKLSSSELPQPDSAGPKSPQGIVPNLFAFALSKVNPIKLSGGTVRVVDSSTFKNSTTIAVAGSTLFLNVLESQLNMY
jgi:hypothetical protein